jgi:hypothetical protein
MTFKKKTIIKKQIKDKLLTQNVHIVCSILKILLQRKREGISHANKSTIQRISMKSSNI